MTASDESTVSSESGGEQTWLGKWAPRVVVVSLLTFAVGAAVTWFFLQTRGFLVMLLLAVFLAFSLEPAVSRLAQRGWRRGVATGLVMAVAVIVGVVFVWAMISLVISQAAVMAQQFPGWLDSVATWLEGSFGLTLDAEFVAEQGERIASLFAGALDNALDVVVGIGTGLLGFVFGALTIGLFVFYLLAQAPELRRAISRPFSPRRREMVLAVWDTSLDKTGNYVYSRSLLAGFSALFHSVAFLIIGLPSAIPLALFVGVVSQFVPNVGTYIAGALPVLVALASNPPDAIWVLVAVIIYQQFENIVLANRITAETMDLHPAVAFGSVIVGASLMGATGALLALPVAATVQAFVSTWVARHELQLAPDPSAEEQASP